MKDEESSEESPEESSEESSEESETEDSDSEESKSEAKDDGENEKEGKECQKPEIEDKLFTEVKSRLPHVCDILFSILQNKKARLEPRPFSIFLTFYFLPLYLNKV